MRKTKRVSLIAKKNLDSDFNFDFYFFRLVLEQISKLEDDRKCCRLVNGILIEKTKV